MTELIFLAPLVAMAIFGAICIYRDSQRNLNHKLEKEKAERAEHSKQLILAFQNMRIALRLAQSRIGNETLGDKRIREAIRQALNNPTRPLTSDEWDNIGENNATMR